MVEIIMHGANYRDGTGQVFTRKEYIKGKPQIKIAKFQGGKRGTYEYCVQLLMNERLQIRHMAIESTRLAANKTLEKTTGESGYYSRLRIYPHNLLRENKQIATAGADRVSEGMRRSWGTSQRSSTPKRTASMWSRLTWERTPRGPSCRACASSWPWRRCRTARAWCSAT